MFMNCVVIPVGVCACVIERRPSSCLRIFGVICLEWGQRSSVTLGKKAEWSTVRTENTHGRSIFLWALGWSYLYPVVGQHTLEFSFYRIFPSFWNFYILKTDHGGFLFK